MTTGNIYEDFGLGIGLRRPYQSRIAEGSDGLGFVEIISENYMDVGPRRLRELDAVRERRVVVMHGVSMSIGSADPLDLRYLRGLRALADRVSAPWVSDHLCWTGVGGHNSHDLLPLALNERTLVHVADRVRQVSDVLERPLLLENPSTYVQLAESTLTEPEFLRLLVEETGCGVLLDVNNVYVSATNHGFDPRSYVDAIPAEAIGQVHLAGFVDRGSHLFDTHSTPVAAEVWALYERLCRRVGTVSTLLEWDADLPPFDVALRELDIAAQIRREVRSARSA